MQRLQRKRTRGWRKPENAVIVSRPSKYGNPFSILLNGIRPHPTLLVSTHRLWLDGRLPWGIAKLFFTTFADVPTPPSAEQIRRDLAGKDLLCFCAEGSPCHADNLLRIANGDTDA
jgi:hypothetical protein